LHRRLVEVLYVSSSDALGMTGRDDGTETSAHNNAREKLTLRELEALARALLAVLLALLHTGVARQKTIGA